MSDYLGRFSSYLLLISSLIYQITYLVIFQSVSFKICFMALNVVRMGEFPCTLEKMFILLLSIVFYKCLLDQVV